MCHFREGQLETDIERGGTSEVHLGGAAAVKKGVTVVVADSYCSVFSAGFPTPSYQSNSEVHLGARLPQRCI